MEQTTTVRVSVTLQRHAARIASALDIPTAEVVRMAVARGLSLIADEEARRIAGTEALESRARTMPPKGDTTPTGCAR